VLGLRQLAVARDRVDEDVGVEDIVTHGRQHLVRIVRKSLGVLGLLEERPDLARVFVGDLDDAELVGQRDRLTDRRDGDARRSVAMLLDHLGEVHAVDVVGSHDDDDVGVLVVDEVEALVDRVRAAEVPVLADPLLRRDRRHVVAEQRRHPPRRRDVLVETVRLVLREDDDLEVARVDDVGEREVDEPVRAAERDGRLRTVGGQGHQALPFPTSEDDRQHLWILRPSRHGLTLGA
jgi:hypothetical protein